MRVLIFGDSITQGFWDISQGGWVARIRRHFDEQEQKTGRDAATIFNLGVSAHSSNELLKRMDNEIGARLNKEPIAVVIAIGVNDSRIKPTGNYMEPNQYRQNLVELLKIAQKHTDKIVFVGLTPCVDNQTHPVAWGDTSYDNDRIRLFDDELKKFCQENRVTFVDMLTAFTGKQAKRNLLPDGLHPNDEGHQFMAEVILPYIEELAA